MKTQSVAPRSRRLSTRVQAEHSSSYPRNISSVPRRWYYGCTQLIPRIISVSVIYNTDNRYDIPWVEQAKPIGHHQSYQGLAPVALLALVVAPKGYVQHEHGDDLVGECITLESSCEVVADADPWSILKIGKAKISL